MTKKKPKCEICGKTISGIDYPNMTNYCSSKCMSIADVRADMNEDKPSIWHRIDKALISDTLRYATNVVWKPILYFLSYYIIYLSGEEFQTITKWSLFLLFAIWIYPDVRHILRLIFRVDKFGWEEDE